MKKNLIIITVISTAALLWSCGGNEQKEAAQANVEAQEETAGEKSENANEASKVDLQRYYVKSGHVQYEMSGTASGGSNLYFDDYGMKEADFEKSVVEIMDQKTESDKLTLMSGDWVYSIDFTNKVGSKSANPVFDMVGDETDLVAVGRKMLEQMGGKQMENEELLGYDCEVWEMQGIKVWIYKGITLNTEADMMGMKIVKKAVKAEFDIDIPEDKFSVPNGIEITEAKAIEVPAT